MPRIPKKVKKPAHRPQIEINWQFVDELLESHCTGTQVAARLGISPDTLYDRTVIEKRVTFSEYMQSKRESGKAKAHEIQFKLMMEGNTKALEWWCANKMGETTKVKQEIEAKQEIAVKRVLVIPDNGRR